MVFFLTTSLLLFFTGGHISAAEKKEDDIDSQIQKQEEEYQRIQKRISTTKKKLSETTKKERTVTQQIEVLSQKITITQQKVSVVTLKVKKIQRNIVKLSNEIVNKNKKIAEVEELLKLRLVSIYKYGGVTDFNLLLSSQGAEDAMANSYLLAKIAEQDQQLITELKFQKQKLNETQEQLKVQKLSLESHGKELKTQTHELKGAANERNSILARVRKDKDLYMAQHNELLRASKELQATVKRLLTEKRKLAAKKNPGKPQTVYYRGGRLAWPVQGTITSTFGTRIHPIFKTKITHTGLDISAPKGTPVKAADTGEVLFTGWLSGYGHVVILDHGGNLTTVYAHLSRIECTEGAKVNRGGLIGRVGSTGVATGNHLHFETRVNGDAVNPMRYLQ
ncbi:MAG: peptidoglycan DD-metalloendopeptidase family protein [Synergistaceae bacterium]|nr:peptidoglycan DD-metalloendopeptidase family protein [Synergistaceae bacterium]